MIDKLELSVPRHDPFTLRLDRLLADSASHGNKRPDRVQDVYDLEPGGYPAIFRLTRFGSGSHTLVLKQAARFSTAAMRDVVSDLLDIDPDDLGIARIDFTVDIPKIPVSWFWTHAYAPGKRCFELYGNFKKTWGSSGETFRVGSQADRYLIYDKSAQLYALWKQRQRGRKLTDSFEDWSGLSRGLVLTRVERQVRKPKIPAGARTLGDLIRNALILNPFGGLRVLDGELVASAAPSSWEFIKQSDLIRAIGTYGVQGMVRKLNAAKSGNGRRMVRSVMDHSHVFSFDDLIRRYRQSTRDQLWPALEYIPSSAAVQSAAC